MRNRKLVVRKAILYEWAVAFYEGGWSWVVFVWSSLDVTELDRGGGGGNGGDMMQDGHYQSCILLSSEKKLKR